jgi:hypothetical protein
MTICRGTTKSKALGGNVNTMVKKRQKLLDAVTLAVVCLKEGEPALHGLGPNQRYVDAFACYSQALRALVSHDCRLHITDWNWNGYEGNFYFQWEFGAPVEQPEVEHYHDTRFVNMNCAAWLDPQKPLSEELDRLRAEATHYNEMRRAMLRWAHEMRLSAGFVA